MRRGASFLGLPVAILMALAACGGGTEGPAPAASTTTPTPSPPVEPAGAIVGRVTGSPGEGILAAVINYGEISPSERPFASVPVEGETFVMEVPRVEDYVPCGVILFEDRNGNGALDEGENFEPMRVVAPGMDEVGIFMFTPGGTYIGNSQWDFPEVEFVGRAPSPQMND